MKLPSYTRAVSSPPTLRRAKVQYLSSPTPSLLPRRLLLPEEPLDVFRALDAAPRFAAAAAAPSHSVAERPNRGRGSKLRMRGRQRLVQLVHPPERPRVHSIDVQDAVQVVHLVLHDPRLPPSRDEVHRRSVAAVSRHAHFENAPKPRYPWTLRQPSKNAALRLETGVTTGLITTFAANGFRSIASRSFFETSLIPSSVSSRTKIRYGTPICGAANPTPRPRQMDSISWISSCVFAVSMEESGTSSAISRRHGVPA
eukprot:30900-Pelagococcus_subviridis.AAC.6